MHVCPGVYSCMSVCVCVTIWICMRVLYGNMYMFRVCMDYMYVGYDCMTYIIPEHMRVCMCATVCGHVFV